MNAADKQKSGSTPSAASSIELGATDIALSESCEPEEIVRQFSNSLYVRGEESSKLVVSKIEFTPLNTDVLEARLLRLHPTDDVSRHVRCDLECHPLTYLPPFVAIKNARGYRRFEEAIEVNGQALLVSVALERFLRYLRTRISKPTLMWVRYACVLEFDPKEQKTYWTREFSDKMYAMASEIFDLHEINSRLIQNGYFEKAVDSRYTDWRKEWYGMPNEVVLPRVCPVRLGTRPNNDAPTMEYQYMPLDTVADEIRIICIMPAESTAAPIVVHVAHCPIKCEVTFMALSYRWGTDLTPEQIILNGQTKMIRRSLAEAIRSIRTTNTIVPLWIDAISINQDDIIERGRQVQRMGQIYDNAMAVYSWVGPQTDGSEEALDFTKELGKHPVVRINDVNEFHFGEWGSTGGSIWYGENTIKPDQLTKLCAALYKFLTRQYFRRAWILQEVAWASNPYITAGRKPGISFDTLDKAAYNFHDMLTRDPSLAGQIQEADPSLEGVNVDVLAYTRKVFYFRHLLSSGASNQLSFYSIKKTSPGFLEALILARDFECTDPKDHIFALWNLARDKDSLIFKPDYSKPYEQVYTDFVQAWIEQHGSLDILGAAEAIQGSQEFYENAPSWSPNWNVPAAASCLVRKDYLPTRFMSAIGDQDGKLYSADGDMHHESFDGAMFSLHSRALHCTGIIIDQISNFLDEPPDIPVGTEFPRCDPISNWQFRCFIDTIENEYQKLGITAYEDPLRAAWAMFHGDRIVAWPPAADSGYEPGICHPNERFVCLPHLSRHLLQFANSYDRTEAWGVVKTVLRGRRPFVTENGYMGLAPAYIAVADDEQRDVGKNTTWQLAIVAGCSVPLLLREREDGTYQLIGTCFVQGWMDGEWIGTMMGAENPKNFWNAIGHNAKFVIT